jgi:glycerol kinase
VNTKNSYVITIDEGTSSTRALMISSTGEIIKTIQKEITQYYPKAGWVEHDAIEIWEKTLACIRELTKACLDEDLVKADEISCLAITNQRETTTIWSARTGKPIHNSIVWQCRRTSELCDKLKNDFIQDKFGNNHSFKDYVEARTGLIVDAYFSATKIKWLLENALPKKNPGSSYNDQQELLFGTIDTWLIWNLSLGRHHCTDTSNASRTMLYDIYENQWDQNILKHLEIAETLMPTVIHSNGDFGSTPLLRDLLDRELPIKAVLGDQQAAFYAYSSSLRAEGEAIQSSAKATYGTGSFVMIPYTSTSQVNKEVFKDEPDYRSTSSYAVAERDSLSFAKDENNKGLIKTNAYTKSDQSSLALEGSIFLGGSLIQWLRDELKMIQSSAEVEELALSVKDNGGVYVIPAHSGLGAPYWNQDIRGAILGLSRRSNKAHIARACLEAIAFSVKDIFEALEPSLKQSITELNVDGGASKNNLLMQIQADSLGIPIKRYTETEMTALGVTLMTGEIELKLKAEKIFVPQNDLDTEYQEWKKYLATLLTC